MSKIVDTNKKIEKAVVEAYNKVEDTVVSTYKKVEDKFVDTFLAKDGETTEEAKKRMQKEQAELEAKNKVLVEESIKKSTEINK